MMNDRFNAECSVMSDELKNNSDLITYNLELAKGVHSSFSTHHLPKEVMFHER